MGKKITGIIAGIILLFVSMRVVYFITVFIGAIFISDSIEAAKNLDALGNILGFLVGAYLFYKSYQHFTEEKSISHSS